MCWLQSGWGSMTQTAKESVYIFWLALHELAQEVGGTHVELSCNTPGNQVAKHLLMKGETAVRLGGG